MSKSNFTQRTTNDFSSPIVSSTNDISKIDQNIHLANENLKSQISLLQDKIKYYETDYFKNTSNLTSQIKQLSLREENLKQELLTKNSIIQQQEQQIRFLQSQIQSHLNNRPRSNSPFINRYSKEYFNIKLTDQSKSKEEIINELIALLKEYSLEISRLKQEVAYFNGVTNSSYNYEDLYFKQSSQINNDINNINKWINDNIFSIMNIPKEINTHKENVIHDISTTANVNLVNFDQMKGMLEQTKNAINELKYQVTEKEKLNINLKQVIDELRNEKEILSKQQVTLTQQINNLKQECEYKSNECLIQNATSTEFKHFLISLYSRLTSEITKLKNEGITSLTFKPVSNEKKFEVHDIENLLSSVIDSLIDTLNEQVIKIKLTKAENEKQSYTQSKQLNEAEKELYQAKLRIDEQANFLLTLNGENQDLKNTNDSLRRHLEHSERDKFEINNDYVKLQDEFNHNLKHTDQKWRELLLEKQNCERLLALVMDENKILHKQLRYGNDYHNNNSNRNFTYNLSDNNI